MSLILVSFFGLLVKGRVVFVVVIVVIVIGFSLRFGGEEFGQR